MLTAPVGIDTDRPAMVHAALLIWTTLASLTPQLGPVDLSDARRLLRAAAQAPPVVIVIGDSHTNGSFGRFVRQSLHEQLGAKALSVGSCGRWSKAFVRGQRANCGLRWVEPDGATRWGKGCRNNPCKSGDESCRKTACRTPTIAELNREYAPDLIIAALGGNAMFRGAKDDGWPTVAPYVRQLAEQIHTAGAKCLWVTPPHGLNKSRRKMRHWAAAIEDWTGHRCAVFDSGPHRLEYLDYRAAVDESGKGEDAYDGIHYDRLGRAGQWRTSAWAAEVAQAADAVFRARGPFTAGIVVEGSAVHGHWASFDWAPL